MANTYTQIFIHAVFPVKYRACLIHEDWENELYKYITGIVQHQRHKMLQINGMPDHIHMLIGMRPSQSLSELMKQVKGDSSAWINRRGLTAIKFQWQAGFGAFSYATSEVPTIIRYIQRQKEHHRKKDFIEEYLDLLDSVEVDYNAQYIFNPVE